MMGCENVRDETEKYVLRGRKKEKRCGGDKTKLFVAVQLVVVRCYLAMDNKKI